jgi:hypothetical protein
VPNWSVFWKRNRPIKPPNTAAQSRLSIRFAERYGASNIARRIQNMNFTGPEAGRGLCVVDLPDLFGNTGFRGLCCCATRFI